MLNPRSRLLILGLGLSGLILSSCSSGSDKTEGNQIPSINKEARLIDIRSFGVVGDGRSDDTTALQAAFDSAQTGDEIPLLGMTLLVSRTVRLSKADVTVRGPGAIRIGGAGKFFAIEIAANDVDIRDLRFENPGRYSFDFVQNGCGAGDLAENHTGAIRVRNSFARILGNVIDGMSVAIEVRGTESTPAGIQILNNEITNLIGSNAECDGGEGIHLQAKNSLIHENKIIHEDEEFSLSGISILGTQSLGNIVSKNTIDGNFLQSIYVHNGVSLGQIPTNPGFHKIHLNTLNGSGILIQNATESDVSGNTLILNPYSGLALGSAIQLSQSPFSLVHRNFIRFNSNRAYAAAVSVHQSDESRVDANEIERPGMTEDFLIADLIDVSNSTAIQIEKNRSAQGLAEVAVRAMNSPRLIVRENDMRDLEDFILHLSSSPDSLIFNNEFVLAPVGLSIQNSERVTIDNNRIQDMATDGIRTNSSAEATVKGNNIRAASCGVKNEGSADLRVFSNTIRHAPTTGQGICGSPAPVYTNDNDIAAY